MNLDREKVVEFLELEQEEDVEEDDIDILKEKLLKKMNETE